MAKRSKVWSLFSIDTNNNSLAKCIQCNVLVSRGGLTSANYTTTNLINHLKRHHPDRFDELKSKQLDDKQTKSKLKQTDGNKLAQPTLAEVVARNVPWSKDHKETVKFNRLVANMIAVDSQPYSVVEDEGFKKLINAALPKYTLPGKLK